MTIDDLLAENPRLRAENAALKQRLAELGAVVQDLQAQLEAARSLAERPARQRDARRANFQPLTSK